MLRVIAQVAEAKRAHAQYVQRVLDFMTEYDLLCCPCVMLAPFDVVIRCVLVAARASQACFKTGYPLCWAAFLCEMAVLFSTI